MSLTLAGATLAGAAIAGGTSFISGLMNKSASEENLSLQKKNLDWQKHVQQKTWDREDTAVQRRMKDLRDAGLNPWSASGQSANAGSVVNTQAPQQDLSYLQDFSKAAQTPANMIGAYIDAMKATEQIKQAKLQTTYQELINKNLSLRNEYQNLFNLDFGNYVDSEWLYPQTDFDGNTNWSLYSWKKNYGSAYGTPDFADIKNSVLGFKRAMGDSSELDYLKSYYANQLIADTYYNDILKVNRDFAVIDKIEGYAKDALNMYLSPKFMRRGKSSYRR